MYVEQIMNRLVWSTTPDASLSEVVGKMVQAGCGWIPVVDEDTGGLAGVLTDRDVALGAWETGFALSEMIAADVMTRDVAACGDRDQLVVAEELMRRRRVRRLPVLDADGRLIGMLGLDGLAQLAARGGNASISGLTGDAVTRVLAACSESPRATDLVASPPA